MKRRRPRTQLDRIERQLSKVAAHTYGGPDPDTGEIVVSHKQRLDEIDKKFDAIEERRKMDAEERRLLKIRSTIKESARMVAAAVAGVIGGQIGK